MSAVPEGTVSQKNGRSTRHPDGCGIRLKLSPEELCQGQNQMPCEQKRKKGKGILAGDFSAEQQKYGKKGAKQKGEQKGRKLRGSSKR